MPDRIRPPAVANSIEAPIRVTAVLPEPTPYRSPLFDLIAQRPDIDLSVVYAADAIAQNRWQISIAHPHVVLRGIRVPGAHRILRHDYPVTPEIFRVLERRRPQVLVVTGWSTFASQAAIAWSIARRIPFVLQVESHDVGPRATWRRVVKGTVVPRIVRRASSVLVTGTLARNSLVARGADPSRVRVFANTVDTLGFAAAAAEARLDRGTQRSRIGLGPSEVAVLSVARLAPEKGLDTLIRAVARADRPRLHLVLAGQGPERESLERLGRDLWIPVTFLGSVEWSEIIETYAACDVFALLSRHEPWAVVVNEAAACGLPLILSDQVGAAHDLLEHRANGFLIPGEDPESAARALQELCDDERFRTSAGRRSQEIAADWGYGPSVDAFVAAVHEAVDERAQ
jgi:glycosyltransferase involved in cell wall biosynthesis